MLIEKSCDDFTRLLAGREPVPGGGGAAALTGALGIALGGMVGSLTAGKPKYAAVEGEIRRLMEAAEKLRGDLLLLVDQDAEAFAPFVRAYALPSATDDEKAARAEALETALDAACEAPLAIMAKCGEALVLLEGFAERGNILAVSDAGTGACLCRAALAGASLNVYANTAAMANRERAAEIERRAGELLAYGEPLAERVIALVRAALGQGASVERAALSGQVAPDGRVAPEAGNAAFPASAPGGQAAPDAAAAGGRRADTGASCG
jgi:formiminotetrahydrofolate cyclodeaminase